jgi:hypothetical protein
MATADNGELMALSGFIKLGVVEEGALADLLLVDGNPLENLKLVADPDKNFLIIMKDGIIYKIPYPNEMAGLGRNVTACRRVGGSAGRRSPPHGQDKQINAGRVRLRPNRGFPRYLACDVTPGSGSVTA